MVFPDEDIAEPLPSLDLEFGDTVAPAAIVPVVADPVHIDVLSILPVVGPVSIGGI